MRKIIATILVLLLLAVVIGIAIYTYISTGTLSTDNVTKLIFVLISVVIALARIHSGGQRGRRSLSAYENLYPDELRGAFANDRKKKNMLLSAIRYYNEDNMKAAIKIIEKLKPKCQARRDKAVCHFFAALFYSDVNCYEIAIREYTESIACDRTNHIAYNNMGLCYNKIGRAEDAVDCYLKSIELKPDYAHAHNNLGIVYRELGEYDKAIECGENALRYNSKMYQAYALLSIVYKIKGDEETSKKYYNMAVGTGQNAKSLQDALNNVQ